MMSRASHFLIVSTLLFLAQLILSVIYPSLQLRLLLGIVAIYYTWKAATFRAGSNSPIGLYVLISAIYVFAALTEIAYFGNRMNLDPLLMGTLTDMGVAFLICVVGGYLLLDKAATPRSRALTVAPMHVTAAIWTCIFMLFACLTMAVAAVGFSIGGLSRSEIYSQDLSFLGLLRGLLSIGLGISAALLAALEKSDGRTYPLARLQLFGTLAAYALQDLLIFGDRRLPLVALLPVGVLFLRKRLTWKQISIGAAVAVVLFTYGFVRNTPPETWWATLASGEIFDVISPASTEFGGLAIIGQTIGGFTGKFWNFPPYIDAFFQIVPRAILPDRPLAPTEWFMDTFFPALSAAGASYAFNQVIEARLNAGILGVVAVGLITGALMSLASRLRYRGAPIGIPLVIYIFAFSMRMDFASILRTAVIAFLGAGVVLAVAAILNLGVSPGPRRTRAL